jgi:hypothetical protein
MGKGYLYVRGLGGSLLWGMKKDASFYSRRELEPIDLGKLSLTRPAAQAVLDAAKCARCGTISFKAFPG